MMVSNAFYGCLVARPFEAVEVGVVPLCVYRCRHSMAGSCVLVVEFTETSVAQ